MPRIYAPVETHRNDWAAAPFVNGAAALPAGADTAHFAALGYHVDDTRHALELWDRMTVAELDALYAYLGGTVAAADKKYEKVRKIESSLSAKYIAALTVASEAGTATGDTKITITSPGTATYYAKTGKTTAPALLYGDVPDSTWTKLTLTAGVTQFTPGAATDDKQGTVRVTAAGTVDAIAADDLVVKS